jgi:hypothetical protein
MLTKRLTLIVAATLCLALSLAPSSSSQLRHHVGATAGTPQTPPADSRITDIAAASDCAKHNWIARGRAPLGYVKGVALIYAKSFCESKGSVETAAAVMKRPLQRDGQDSLVRYQDDLTRNGVDVNSDVERLRALFALGIAEGMRESSGNTTEGRDVTARHPTAESAEAGLFQVSFDSFGKSPALAKLFDQYKANAGACRLETFMEGVRDRRASVFGSGTAAEFQRFTKECPAFATEYAMVMMRVNRKHFGPIERHEAEFFAPCNAMLKQVETVLTCTP